MACEEEERCLGRPADSSERQERRGTKDAASDPLLSSDDASAEETIKKRRKTSKIDNQVSRFETPSADRQHRHRPFVGEDLEDYSSDDLAVLEDSEEDERIWDAERENAGRGTREESGRAIEEERKWTYRAVNSLVPEHGDFSKLTGNESLNEVLTRISVLLVKAKDGNRRFSRSETEFLADAWLTHRYDLANERIVGLETRMGDYSDIVFIALANSIVCPATLGDLVRRTEIFQSSLPRDAEFALPEREQGESGDVTMSWFRDTLWTICASWDVVTRDAFDDYANCAVTCIGVAAASLSPGGTVFRDERQLDVAGWAVRPDARSMPAVTMTYVRDVEAWLAGLFSSLRFADIVSGKPTKDQRGEGSSRRKYSAVPRFSPDSRVKNSARDWVRTSYERMDYDIRVKRYMQFFMDTGSHPGECFHYSKRKREKPLEPREAIEIEHSQLFSHALTAQVDESVLFGSKKTDKVPGPVMRKAKDVAIFVAANSALERDCQTSLDKHFISYSQYECYGLAAFDALQYPAVASVGCFYLLITDIGEAADPVCVADDAIDAICAFVNYQAAVKKSRLAAALYKLWEK